jgi:hypothetical protein
MEFLNCIVRRGYSSLLRLEVLTIIFPFYKIRCMNRLEFSCFADFFVCVLENHSRVWISLKSASIEGTVNSIAQNTRVFCQIHIQEFHLLSSIIFCTVLMNASTRLCRAEPTKPHPPISPISQLKYFSYFFAIHYGVGGGGGDWSTFWGCHGTGSSCTVVEFLQDHFCLISL